MLVEKFLNELFALSSLKLTIVHEDETIEEFSSNKHEKLELQYFDVKNNNLLMYVFDKNYK